MFNRALKVTKRARDDLENLADQSQHPSKKMRRVGGGQKAQAPEVCAHLFAWFVDIRLSLKGRLPRSLLRAKAKLLYQDWLKTNPVPEDERLQFGNQWIKDWTTEFGISLSKPNKRFTIKAEDLI